MDKRTKFHFIVVYSLVIAQAALLAGFYFWGGTRVASEVFSFDRSGEKFTLYIGTNDKDTYKREIPLEECRRRIDAICRKHVTGFSTGTVKGKWVDETGTLTEEDTFVYVFYGTTDATVKTIMDEVLVALNQNSILLEKESVTSTFHKLKKDR